MKYTKIPNNILDSMADLKPAAFKLAMALCRLTYGYHRDEVKASLSDLQEITGLSRPAIVSASKEVEHLFASEKREKRITTYLVNRVYQIEETSKQSLPDELTEFTSSGKDSLPDTSSLKKERKLKEIIIWATFFEGMTGFIPPHESTDTFEDDWYKPLKAIMSQSHNDAEIEERITYGVKSIREKGYTIKSPKSILTFALNKNGNGTGKQETVKQSADGGIYV